MKKGEFKKLLKKEDHLIVKESNLIIISCIIVVLMTILLLVLENLVIIPNLLSLIIFCGFIILFAIPNIYLDLSKDIKIKKLFESYKKDKKILEVKDNTKILKMLIIFEIIVFVLFGCYFTFQIINMM